MLKISKLNGTVGIVAEECFKGKILEFRVTSFDISISDWEVAIKKKSMYL